jgi:hypothetical protein
MFGMLDYRAYKLLWLICLPLRLVIWIAAWGLIVIAIMISTSFDYGVLVRIVIAYAIWEGAAIVLQIVGGILFWFIKKVFFWLIDVVPAKAESVAEAKEMVVGGPITWLGKKFLTDIHNWTEDDTEQFASLMNWRARLFFHSTERIRQRVRRFQELYEATGSQPGDLTEEERQKVVADLDYSRFEKAIINPIAFNAIVRIIIISFAIVSLDNSVPYNYSIPGNELSARDWVVISISILMILSLIAYLREAHANKLMNESGWWIRIAAFVGIGFAWLFVGWAIKNERGVWWIAGLMTLFAVCVIVLVKTRRFTLRKYQPRVDEGESNEWNDTDKEKFKRLMDEQSRR